ncbi:A/G-specific adenine glycosylase [Blattabacterium cuenoti]|uniref:A/G-specific adenine glycosylase n=1 Tax=Blattabacterium cuenoti TaxID=1653831 RepID=UPI001EEA6A3C|nr:A/G-specific adenine glycosylase [Blattabacterium cuenoti]
MDWYKINHRKLPWRETKNPYYILVSEFMLQQTKVSKVIKSYLNFIKVFPNMEELALSEERKVLKIWEGLGYYTRAINLHFLSKKLVRNGISFPDSYEELIKYKGIGPYTGAAIASICFNKVVPAIDGNAYRVFSRYLGIYKKKTEFTKENNNIRTSILKIMDQVNPGIFNQAIMDFGSMLCTPKKAKCSICPVRFSCFSFNYGKVYELPIKNVMNKYKKRRFFYYIFMLDNNHRICIKKRNEKDIWKGLYDFPLIEKGNKLSCQEIKNEIWKQFKLVTRTIIYQVKHQLNHQILFIQFLDCEILDNTKKFFFDKFFFLPKEKIIKYPFPIPISRFLKNKKII